MTVKEYLNLDFNDARRLEYNDNLVKCYPWLARRNVFTDKLPENNTFTWLDDMPEGWRIAFGMEMVKEIDNALKEFDCVYSYRISQIKEKYGTLRWYDFGAPQVVANIISKYTTLSKETCIYCGNPATRCTEGWIEYLCEDCYRKVMKELC